MPKSKPRKKSKKSLAKTRYPFVPATEDKFIVIEDDPITFIYKVTGTIANEAKGTVIVKSIPIEDSIRPVELKFPPALQKEGSEPTCFEYQWEQLTFLFGLDDPSKFMNLFGVLTDDEKRLLMRFVSTCQNLASYSVINSKNSVKMSWGASGPSTVQVDLSSHEEFSGFSATFRQLHNDGETASWQKALSVINRAANAAGLDPDDLAAVRATLKQWRKARARLNEKTAPTMIAERLNKNLKPEHPLPLKGVVPEDLIRKFNYGDTLHWGDQREKLADLTNGDPFNERYHKYCCQLTMSSLSHYYFGFAVLVAAALGVPELGQEE